MSNTNLEADFALLAPRGVTVHTTRVGGYDLDEIPDGAQMAQLATTSLDAVLDLLVACRPDVIVYGCTSATLALGPDFDAQLRERIETRTGARTITAASAVTEALTDLNLTQVGFCSPYVHALNLDARRYLEASGFQTVAMAEVESDLGNYGQGELHPDEILALGRRADHPLADGVVMSCTDMRAVEVVDALERIIGKPVVTSNQALMYAALKRLDVCERAAMPAGMLMRPRIAPGGSGAPLPKPGLRDLAPYPAGDAAEDDAICLAQNECAFAPSDHAVRAATEALRDAHQYGDGSSAALRGAIASTYGLAPERIVCGHGSAELIDLLAQAFCEAGDEVLVPRLGYLYFDNAATLAGARIVRAEAAPVERTVDALLNAVTSRTRVVMLDNPNNPTGGYLPATELTRLREALAPEVLLVIDAAYAEYVTAPDYSPGVELVENTTNTVMLRTFSKVHGLAGLRVGWAYCSSAVQTLLDCIRQPNNVAAPAQAACIAALADPGRSRRVVDENTRARAQLRTALKAAGLTMLPSETNFVLVEFASPEQARGVYHGLKQRRILVRPMEGYGLPACLRFTIGTPLQMERVVAVLDDIHPAPFS